MKQPGWLILMLAIVLTSAGWNGSALAGGDGAQGEQEFDCGCNAHHEAGVKRAAERYLEEARTLREENPAEALRLARLAVEVYPKLDGAQGLVAELEGQ
jgi:hypothetical protein